jgi:hypothetical protein
MLLLKQVYHYLDSYFGAWFQSTLSAVGARWLQATDGWPQAPFCVVSGIC